MTACAWVAAPALPCGSASSTRAGYRPEHHCAVDGRAFDCSRTLAVPRERSSVAKMTGTGHSESEAAILGYRLSSAPMCT